jgi:hypothetical protein
MPGVTHWSTTDRGQNFLKKRSKIHSGKPVPTRLTRLNDPPNPLKLKKHPNPLTFHLNLYLIFLSGKNQKKISRILMVIYFEYFQ